MTKQLQISHSLASALVLLLVASSCISQKKLEYLQGKEQPVVSYSIAELSEPVVKPGDELYIRVSSFDDVQYNFFGSQSENRQMSLTNDVSVSLISYDVNDSGYVNFPLLGYVKLSGYTLEEATEQLKILLNDYTNQPTVVIKLVNKRVSVLGEVVRPGHYVYTKNRLMLLEAVSLAGDITVFGNKKRVMIIREEGNSVKKILVDLTQENLMATSDFFIKQNDVIYVPPMQSRTWSLEAIPWNLILSSITTFILVLNFINI